ncbi:MAG: hypothetical protein ACPGXZ_00575 [Saprospiraceae bacterium]
MVRLKVENSLPLDTPMRDFNPNMIRLKGLFRTFDIYTYHHFNPNMVRLKVSPSSIIQKFQRML